MYLVIQQNFKFSNISHSTLDFGAITQIDQCLNDRSGNNNDKKNTDIKRKFLSRKFKKDQIRYSAFLIVCRKSCSIQ